MCGEGRFYVVVLVVVVVVGFQSYVSALVQQIFQVEVADEGVVVDGIVAVAYVAVDDETVVEQLARQSHFYLHIGKVALVAAQVGTDVDIFVDLAQQVVELARKSRGGYRYQFVVTGLSHVHVVGGIKFAQGEQIDNLSIDHVVGADDAAYAAVDVLRNRGKFKVEAEVGLLQVPGEEEQGSHGNGRAVQVGFGGETLVEIFEIGREGIVGLDVEIGVLGSPREGYAATGFYDKVFGDEVLQTEIVVSLFYGIGPVEFHVGERIVFEPYVAAARGVYHIAGGRVHEQVH